MLPADKQKNRRHLIVSESELKSQKNLITNAAQKQCRCIYNYILYTGLRVSTKLKYVYVTNETTV